MSFSEALMRLFGTFEVPSLADIIPSDSIVVDPDRITIKMDKLNIPFTKRPVLLPILDIPDTNSMDGVMDAGNNNLLFHPADAENDKIMVDWIAKTWLESKGLLTVDAVYRIPPEWDFVPLIYAIHRLVKVGTDSKGRYFYFKGVNNPTRDPYKVRDENLLFLSAGVIY